MKSGEVIAKAGITRDALRYYLEIGLIKPRVNPKNGYKIYTEDDAELLTFIKQAQGIGFTLSDIKKLAKQMKSSKCKHQSLLPYLKDKFIELEEKIAAMEGIRGHLAFLIENFESKDCEVKEEGLEL